MLYAKFGSWNLPNCSGKENFKISSMYLCYFVVTSSIGSGEDDENWKSLQTDRQTDRQQTNSGQKSSLEVLALELSMEWEIKCKFC